MNKDQSIDQLVSIFLTGNQGEDLVICSELRYHKNSSVKLKRQCRECRRNICDRST